MKKNTILTNELLKEIKSVLDNSDWSYCSGHEDSEKACNFLNNQKWSLSYLNNHFSNNCDIDFVNELIDDGLSFVDAFIKEAACNIAEDRCNRFAWSGKHGTWGWNLQSTGFELIK